MSPLMEQVIERLRAVPVKQQEQVARFLLQELDEEVRWMLSTAEYERQARDLIDDVLADDRDGRSKPLDPDRL